MKKEKKLRWEDLIDAEPELLQLLALAKTEGKLTKTWPRYCANQRWGQLIKPRLRGLVGLNARVPELRSIQAYDLAHDTIYKKLPNCRGCSCL